MLGRSFLCAILLSCFLSCKTVAVDQETLKTTHDAVTLSSIGIAKDNVLDAGFKNTAIPRYKKPIKVDAIMVSFNKNTYKAFQKAAQNSSKGISIRYVDSLEKKPQFVTLRIADRVAMLNELNKNRNADVKDYLSSKTDATIVTNISMALSSQLLNDMRQAKTVFLVQNESKSYALELDMGKETKKQILFLDGVVFAYKASNFCWQEDDKGQIRIVDMVEGYKGCPPNTYRSAKRAKKKINYFKL